MRWSCSYDNNSAKYFDFALNNGFVGNEEGML
jgi:hypothetical protein